MALTDQRQKTDLLGSYTTVCSSSYSMVFGPVPAQLISTVDQDHLHVISLDVTRLHNADAFAGGARRGSAKVYDSNEAPV